MSKLKILAFSDWRVQDLDEILNFIKNFDDKIDLVVYAGDDISRFSKFSRKDILELIKMENFINSDETSCKISFGNIKIYIFKTPKEINNEIKFQEYLNKNYCDNNYSFSRQLKKEVIKLPSRSKHYNLWCVQYYESDINVFKEIAKYTKYGVLVIPGNDDSYSCNRCVIGYKAFFAYSLLVKGKKVYNIQNASKTIKDFVFLGWGGQPFYTWFDGTKSEVVEKIKSLKKKGINELLNYYKCWGAFTSVDLYQDDVYYAFLKYHIMKEINENSTKNFIIVSHTPPYGILDIGIRFGIKHVGSIALREIINEFSEKIPLVICGHVHSHGGKFEKLNNTYIVNVSSGDDIYDPGNIAYIEVSKNGIESIKFFKLNSKIKSSFKKIGIILKEVDNTHDNETLNRIKNKLAELGLSNKPQNNEVEMFIDYYKKYGNQFLDDIDELYNLKFNYSFTWENVLLLYKYGVKRPEDITEEIYNKVRKETKFPPQLERGYRKILSERINKIDLIKPLPKQLLKRKVIVFDTEYCPHNGKCHPAIYGFLDVETMEFKQFLFEEEKEIIKFLEDKLKTYIFVHYGGADKSIIKSLVKGIRTHDLLYTIQTSLVIPNNMGIYNSDSLSKIYKILCKNPKIKVNEKFLDVDGVRKAMISEKIINKSANREELEFLLNVNREDVYALYNVYIELLKLNKKYL